MNLKKILLALCLLFLLPAPLLAEEEPIIYTVKQGDTLWDISQRFIKDPYYWPNLWSHNPDIGNPHVIYPGQRLRIYDGRIEIIPINEDGEKIVTDGSVLITPEAIEWLDQYGGARGFVSAAEVSNLGTLVDAADSRYLLTDGDTVFLKMAYLDSVKPGDLFELVELGASVPHPVTRESVGVQATQVGFVAITEVSTEVTVGILEQVNREIQRGAKARMFKKLPKYIPRQQADLPISGYIISATDSKIALADLDIIYLDVGSEDGLEVGHELEIFRPRELTKSARPIKRWRDDNIMVLPNINLGEAVVIEVHNRTAAALITKIGNLPMYRGDKVMTILP